MHLFFYGSICSFFQRKFKWKHFSAGKHNSPKNNFPSKKNQTSCSSKTKKAKMKLKWIKAQLAVLRCSLVWAGLILGVSPWKQVHQCLGSGSELRKSSGVSEGVLRKMWIRNGIKGLFHPNAKNNCVLLLKVNFYQMPQQFWLILSHYHENMQIQTHSSGTAVLGHLCLSL